MPVRILYRDPYMLLCEKTVGLSSESPGLPEIISDQTGQKVFPVHRLDQGTGGVMVFALSPNSCSALQSLFQQDLICKEYLAVVSGRPSEDTGNFLDYLFHDRKKNKSYVVDLQRKGVKEARCRWTVLQSVPFEGQVLSLVRVGLHTGRTHQIRIQFASRGFPLVGDGKYGSRMKAVSPALWSCRLSFPHPYINGYSVNISSFPPDSFPWTLFDCSCL